MTTQQAEGQPRNAATTTPLTSPHPWRAPYVTAPIHGSVQLPGSKSQTNRELVLAAIADGPSRITDGLRARDSDLMIDGLRAMGAKIDVEQHSWLVTPQPLHGAKVDAGLAGTVMRFLPAVAALAHGDVHFDGDLYARVRPVRALIDALRQAGVTVEDSGTWALPFTVHGVGQANGGVIHVDASASSQFISALLLAGARYDNGVDLRHVGSGPVPSTPHIEMTLEALRARGVDAVATGAQSWRVRHGQIAGRDVTIEPDLSNAAPFLAAAVVTGGSVSVPGWPAVTTQAGDALRGVLAQFGAHVEASDHALHVSGTGSIRGVQLDMHHISELITIVAAIAAVADGPSRLTGLAHTRGHETDRLAALHAQLSHLGAHVVEHEDGLEIEPRPLHGGAWKSYDDHRMATAGAVLGLVVDGVDIDDIDCTSKTLPHFTQMWNELIG